jgi:NNP family nitrate/nitrite transporter-like MFS transporter
MAAACGVVLVASAEKSLAVYTVGFVLLFILSGLGNGSTYKMIPSIFQGKAKVAISEGAVPEVAMAKARRLSGAVIGIAGSIGALGGLFINLAFRQSFLTTKSGDAAFWGFLAFYGLCVAVTYAVYLRPVPAAQPTTRLAYARV